MNYRHAFHAGNFADVFKHAAMARILAYLTRKDAALRVIDTHAGAGFHALDSSEASRTGEWQEGIGRHPDRASGRRASRRCWQPWLDFVAESMAQRPPLYPGSPALAQHLTRAQDRLFFCEKHPDEAERLAAGFAGDRRVKTIAGDGWRMLASLLPPPERRGLVVIDPPFEEEDEFGRIVSAMQGALRRFATGTYLIWYPIKGRREVDAFARKLADLPAAAILRARDRPLPT